MVYGTPVECSESFKINLVKNTHLLIDSLAENYASISYGNSILNLSSLDSLRLIYDNNSSNKINRLFKNLLIKTYSDSESRCPGSGFISLISFLKASISFNDIDNSLAELKTLSFKSKRGKKIDLKEIIEGICNEESILKICSSIFETGGFSSSCEIETTYNLEDSVSIDDSHTFDIKLDPNFSLVTKIEKFSANNADIILADGIIESVSEIHHILEYYFQTSKTCFLVCRGYEPEVISTLSKNFLRKSLRVVPCILNYGLDSINSLKDISIISGTDLISNLKGERISSINTKEIQQVDFLSVCSSNLQIRNKKNNLEILKLSKNLKRRLEKENSKDIRDILEKRISSLSPRKLKILLSNHSRDNVGLKKDRIKALISIINSTCTFGIIGLNFSVEDYILKDIINFFKRQNINKLPSRIFFDGVSVGLINAQIFKNSEYFILLDD